MSVVAIDGENAYVLCGDPDCPSCSDFVADFGNGLVEVDTVRLEEALGTLASRGGAVLSAEDVRKLLLPTGP